MTQSTTHITTSGGLISAAFVETIREPASRQRGIEPASFALPWADPPRSPATLEDEIAAAWELLLERWDAVREDLRMMDVSQVRARWLLPLFRVLDFDPQYLRGDVVVGGDERLRYPLSHEGWDADAAPILHTVPPSQPLDERAGSGRGIKAKSPHDMLQAFLNASPHDLWAVLSNGILLRILRDYHHTFTKGYVEFDLEAIFETRNYGDFRALYRMCHASRFVAVATSEVSETSEVLPPLEQFYKDSLATGVKVGEDLRGQVRQAIETLGNGFLATSPDLIAQLQGNDDRCQQFYGEILHVIYRVLFLLFAEQRGMMPGRDSLYAETYSIARLRARAEGDIPREDDFTDLWHGLQVTFEMVRRGVPELGVFGYDGMLFEDHAVGATHASPLQDRAVRNSDLLHAIRSLTLIEREGVLQRISYADLGVEELGSIYESLLDFTPRVTGEALVVDEREIPAHTFFLDPRGSERKTTGSYYTHPSLVNELIKSALLPVARDRLAAAGLPVVPEDEVGEVTTGLLDDYAGLSADDRAAGAEALLDLTVCDPAAGSGHFLVKANNALGAELARIRTGDDYPSEAAIQAAKRDVLAYSIYAVDLNPMAVELCKVSLWINASVADQPLSFLDHHIKCGNSLLGTTPELMADGIPYEAFDQGIVGNDRATANAIRKRNRQERRDLEQGGGYQPALFQTQALQPTRETQAEYVYVSTLAEEDPQAARERYAEYLAGDDVQRRMLEANTWTAAFFWPLPAVGAGHTSPNWTPTHGAFRRLQTEGPEALPAEALAQVEALAERYRFFHWHLEFPEVFEEPPAGSEPAGGWAGGFDVILGNPPWERIKLQEKEFFASRASAIANARTASARRKLIKRLPQTDPELHAAYVDALRESEAVSHFLRESGRYPLSAVGDINTYQVFCGLARQIVGPAGRVGMVVPSGIATDYFNQDYFSTVVEERELVSFYDFENREGLFPGTHRSYKFALLTLTGGKVPEAEYAFFLHTTDDLADPERRFGLSREEVALMNPNTGTVPVFRTRRDAELTKKLYRAAPVLVNQETGENPWGISFLRMFDMTNDSHLFHTREELEAEGFVLEGNRFVRGDEVYLPLYEGKMFWHFDHRFGTYEGVESRSNVHLPNTDLQQYRDPSFLVLPWYWVERDEVVERLQPETRWFLAFRDITNSTNERTAVFTILPWTAMSNKAPLLLTQQELKSICVLLGNLDSMPFDFIARQKMGGTSLNFYIVEQFPVLPPERYTPALLDIIVPRVVELTYTAWDLQPFARDVLAEVGPERWGRWFAEAPVHQVPGTFPERSLELTLGDMPSVTGSERTGKVPGTSVDTSAGTSSPFPPPFVWDEDRRAVLRAELDAVYAHLYGLSREELAYILDTFPIVKRKDEAAYGEYRTKRMVLEAFEALDLSGFPRATRSTR